MKPAKYLISIILFATLSSFAAPTCEVGKVYCKTVIGLSRDRQNFAGGLKKLCRALTVAYGASSCVQPKVAATRNRLA